VSDGIDVRLDRVTKRFGSVTAVRDVSLDVRRGEILGLLGPSGCGKTTTLRIIAGLEDPDDGTVAIRGEVVNEAPPYRRNLGMVFQHYALFPHMSVFDNIAFGLRMRRLRRREIAKLVGEAMELVRLSGLEERFPSQLSGGQQQRVALARAIVTKPAVLLLDEPLGALDKKLREEMQVEIKQLQREVRITTIFVTHDQEEALTLSDRIAVMEGGEIIQVGTPTEIYERPRSRFVSDFIGVSNFLPGRVVAREEGVVTVETDGGMRLVAAAGTEVAIGAPVELAVRPEKIRIGATPGAARNGFRGTVERVVYLGCVTYYHVRLNGKLPLMVMTQNETPLPGSSLYLVGQEIYVGWELESTLLLQRGAGGSQR